MPGEHSWKDFDKDIKEVATALGIAGVGLSEEIPMVNAEPLPDPEDMASHPTKEEVPMDDAKALPDPEDMASHPTSETHNPLDIPFGYEVETKEVNMNPKDPEIEEGGTGSGRNPEAPGDPSSGSPGPLVSFGETIIKEFVDAKLSCPCNQKK